MSSKISNLSGEKETERVREWERDNFYRTTIKWENKSRYLTIRKKKKVLLNKNLDFLKFFFFTNTSYCTLREIVRELSINSSINRLIDCFLIRQNIRNIMQSN